MQYYNYDIVLPDVPGEISLAFSIVGCQLSCKGCFWDDLKPSAPTYPLTDQILATILNRYQPFISCVLFYGGEWHLNELMNKLKIARAQQLKTCLYTGLRKIPSELLTQLTYLKTGPYREELGGLTNPQTNQRLIEVATNLDLTHKFWQLLPAKNLNN